MSAQHTPGRDCVECEGFCLVAQQASMAPALHIGQHVRHRDYRGMRVTGTVRSLAIEDQALMATISLDSPIVIPAGEHLPCDINIYTQHVPAHEVSPFDDRDELIHELAAAMQAFVGHNSSDETVTITVRTADVTRARAAIAKATGSAS